MPQFKSLLLNFGFLIIILFTTNSKAQDSSLIKINYGFSYDYHNYHPTYNLQTIKSGFCYTNSLGLSINYYLFKRKRIGITGQLNVGDKAMSLRGEYKQMIDSYYRNPVYKTEENFNFKYDYLIYGYNFKVSYIIKKKIEPFIGLGRYFATLNSQNFKQDSIVIAINHGYNAAYKKTYILPNKVTLNMITLGTNLILSKKIQIGIFATHYLSKALAGNKDIYERQGSASDAVFFDEYISFGISASFKLF